MLKISTQALAFIWAFRFVDASLTFYKLSSWIRSFPSISLPQSFLVKKLVTVCHKSSIFRRIWFPSENIWMAKLFKRILEKRFNFGIYWGELKIWFQFWCDEKFRRKSLCEALFGRSLKKLILNSFTLKLVCLIIFRYSTKMDWSLCQ